MGRERNEVQSEILIEEKIGTTSRWGTDSVTRKTKYLITGTLDPEEARIAFEDFAKGLPLPKDDNDEDLELSDASLDERDVTKWRLGVFDGSITFQTPGGDKVKTKWDDDLYEMFGESHDLGRLTESHKRVFRITAVDAGAAAIRLGEFIRNGQLTYGRLHFESHSVAENATGDGEKMPPGEKRTRWYFAATATYSNPLTKTIEPLEVGLADSYGNRFASSRKGQTQERRYRLRGYEDEKTAWEALSALYGLDPTCDTIEVEEDSGGAEFEYIGIVRYASPENNTGKIPTEEEPRGWDNDHLPNISFEIGSTQTKMIKSLETVERIGFHLKGGLVERPPDFNGLINVSTDGVEGVDVDVTETSFTETHSFFPENVTAEYRRFLSRNCGKVNFFPWRGYYKGEVRFLGVSFNYKIGDHFLQMNFKFGVSPNARNIKMEGKDVGTIFKKKTPTVFDDPNDPDRGYERVVIGGVIPFKAGWDYVWYDEHKEEVDFGDRKISVSQIHNAYIERIYEWMDMSQLRIGF